jgi:CRP-like cAMP-binding protein
VKVDDARPNDFFIWGIDDAPYGPVELPTLVNWIKDGRVEAGTWVFSRSEANWRRATDLQELKMFFGPGKVAGGAVAAAGGIGPGSLRRIKIFAELGEAELRHLADYLEPQRIPQWTVVVKQGEPGDAMYFVLEGELRASVHNAGRETILAAFAAGDFFGDLALFDNGPRSADVTANVDSTVLRLSAVSFSRLVREAPALATPFLQATARTLAARIRADNKRLERVTQQFHSSVAGDRV